MPPVVRSWREKLDYLAEKTGSSDLELVSRAVDEGVTVLYQRTVSEAYLRGEINREQAVEELGEDVVEDLDFARHAVERDVMWGLRGA